MPLRALDEAWLRGLLVRIREQEVDLDALLRHVVDEAVRGLGADRGTLYLVDHARNELVSRVAQLYEIAEIRLRIGEGIAGYVARTGESVIVRDGDDDPRLARRFDEMTGYRTRTVLAVPIRDRGGQRVGVFQLLNKGAGDFDADDEEALLGFSRGVAELLDASSLRSQLHPDLRQPLSFRFNHIVGESAVMQKVYDRTERAAATDATVLLSGESGTGKELIARAVHFNSARREAPFVKVDCAALPDALVENELFGHERGAFTGADRAVEGKVQQARGGTLFLDEVGELPLVVQGKLLRLLQDQTFFRVGGSRAERADLRFVAATNRDLAAEVAAGRFRQDLYYRLRVVEIALPPLRARGGGDLDRLIDHFLFEFSRRHHRPDVTLGAEARAELHAHDWPGNVRELENCIESAVVLASSDEIAREELEIGPSTADDALRHGAFVVAGEPPLEEVERAYVAHVVERCGGNRTRAAAALGIGRNTLVRKLRE